MTGSPLPLNPFESEDWLRAFHLEAQVWRQSGCLRIRYQLQGPIETLLLPGPAGEPCRLDGLWRGTCFEAFLAIEGLVPYWEINLSSTGDWNGYHLSGYRHNLEPELAFESLPFTSHRTTSTFQLDVGVDLGPIGPGGLTLEVALAAVIEHRSGALSHWALAHPTERADFHHRGGFVLRL
jgi:hypothetical protein